MDLGLIHASLLCSAPPSPILGLLPLGTEGPCCSFRELRNIVLPCPLSLKSLCISARYYSGTTSMRGELCLAECEAQLCYIEQPSVTLSK